ncbi:hypothetical protein ACVW0A_003355 [Pseudomonas sp. TE3610]
MVEGEAQDPGVGIMAKSYADVAISKVDAAL